MTQDLKLSATARNELTKDAINIVVTTNAYTSVHRPPASRCIGKAVSRLVLKRTDYCGETKK